MPASLEDGGRSRRRGALSRTHSSSHCRPLRPAPARALPPSPPLAHPLGIPLKRPLDPPERLVRVAVPHAVPLGNIEGPVGPKEAVGRLGEVGRDGRVEREGAAELRWRCV